MMPIKQHVPERTCVACRRKRPKQELTRLVRTLEGNIEIDLLGRSKGRGAYLCKRRRCWESVLVSDRKNRLARALRIELTPERQLILYE